VHPLGAIVDDGESAHKNDISRDTLGEGLTRCGFRRLGALMHWSIESTLMCTLDLNWPQPLQELTVMASLDDMRGGKKRKTLCSTG